MGLGSGYLLLVLATAGLGLAARFVMWRTARRWSQVDSGSARSGAEVARAILRVRDLRDVRVEGTRGALGDHYDPRERVLRLSPDVHDGRSVTAVGVAAHEVGHALQHAEGWGPLALRTVLAPAAAVGSNLAMLAVVVGLGMGALGLVKLGLVLFGVMVAFVLVTLPVELDASARARQILPSLGVRGEAARGADQVLRAAALTYLAAAVGSVATLAWLVGLARR